MSQLTEHQSEKLEEILSHINDRKFHILLKGSAGVGKTYLVGELIKQLERRIDTGMREKILCSAPTHKALSVIRTKVLSDVKFNTIHAALSYKGVTNRQTGEKEFISLPHPDYPPLKKVKFWVIDEASMIDSKMLENIKYYASEQKTTVIFVGDGKQINPVGEDDSPVFMQDFPTVELTEIIRQGAGNPIITLSRDLDLIHSKQEQLYSTEPLKGYVYTMNMEKIINELAKVNGTDEMKYLAWSNMDVDRVNILVRKKIYGDNPAKIELGETIVFNGPYKGYTTNEELLVETLEKKTVTINVTLEDGRKKTVSEEAKFTVFLINETIMVLDDSSVPLFKRYAAIMTKNCKEKLLTFESRNKYLDTFADFKYNHAITVHKSQGSTYKTTILNVKNIGFNSNLKEKTRLFYTGVTRASDLLILYNV